MTSSKLYRMRKLMRHVPSEPRCKLCNTPFRGIGAVFKVAGFGPSRKNPNFCNTCFERAPLGGEEMDIGVLFADVRGFTSLAETLPPAELEARLRTFYETATDVLMRHDAVIDKLVGDEVMALFLPQFAGHDLMEKMVSSSQALLGALGYDSGSGEEPQLPLGVGVAFGTAFVGNVGHDDVLKDFTALGDVVNVAQRLQKQAGPGEIVLSEGVYDTVWERFPEAVRVELGLKGKRAPVAAYVIGAS